MEEWRPVIGFELFYSVSSIGRIRRDSGPNASAKNAIKGRILNPEIISGYERFALCAKPRREKVLGHIIVAAAFIGDRPNGKEINHKNGNRRDNRVENLEYVTKSENIIHRRDVLKHRWLRGEEVWKAKLSESDVAQIKSVLASDNPPTHRELARQYGVYKGTIGKIIRGEIWKHLNH